MEYDSSDINIYKGILILSTDFNSPIRCNNIELKVF